MSANALEDLHVGRKIRSITDDERLRDRIVALLEAKLIEEIPVGKTRYSHSAERWFRDCSVGDVYRYVEPNFPALGVWEPLT